MRGHRRVLSLLCRMTLHLSVYLCVFSALSMTSAATEEMAGISAKLESSRDDSRADSSLKPDSSLDGHGTDGSTELDSSEDDSPADGSLKPDSSEDGYETDSSTEPERLDDDLAYGSPANDFQTGSSVVRETQFLPLTPFLTRGSVTKFKYEHVFSSMKLETYQKGDLDELYDLIDLISDSLDCDVLQTDGQNVPDFCTAAWNIDQLTLDVPGIYSVTAQLSPPEDCTFASGVRQQIVIPVQIITPDGPPVLITSVDDWIPNQIAVAVPKGDPVETVMNHEDMNSSYLDCTDENGGSHTLSIDWDFAAIDMNTTGVYRVGGTLKPPVGLAFTPDLELPVPVLTVSIQTPGSPDINCFSRGRGNLRFPYLLSPEQIEQIDLFQVWISTDGEWRKLNENYQIFSDEMRISLSIFSAGIPYQLQLDYPGGRTGILSITYDGSKLACEYSQGDRDGGDTGGSKPPNLTIPPAAPPGQDKSSNHQKDENHHSSSEHDTSKEYKDKPITVPLTSPLPQMPTQISPPSAPTASPEPSVKTGAPELAAGAGTPPDKPAMPSAPAKPEDSGKTDYPLIAERFDETSSTISGQRLRMMTEDMGMARFSRQNITVTLSREAVEALGVLDDSVFYIEIRRISNRVFSLQISVDDTNVTALPDVKIMLPYMADSKHVRLSIQEEGNLRITAGNYDESRGIADFTLPATGYFTIYEEEIPAPQSAPVLPVSVKQSFPVTGTAVRWSAAVVCLLLLAAVGRFYIKRRR